MSTLKHRKVVVVAIILKVLCLSAEYRIDFHVIRKERREP